MPQRYHNDVSRFLTIALLLSIALFGQQQKPPQQEPPEEDETLAPKEYSFNPVQAKKEVTIGNYYFKKGNYRAAAKRFTEASKWNPGYAEAYLRLGDAQEKLRDRESAKTAYQKYLDLEPDAKNAGEIKKKISKTH